MQRQLAPDSRYFIGADLDKHLDAILQNSMAVAHVSRDRYREAILGLCSEVRIILGYLLYGWASGAGEVGMGTCDVPTTILL